MDVNGKWFIFRDNSKVYVFEMHDSIVTGPVLGLVQIVAMHQLQITFLSAVSALVQK
jgi:hypothetical protein